MTRLFKTYIFILLLLPSLVIASQEYSGRVVGVSDGDTITVLVAGTRQLKVRLAQIDAPEKSQAFGQRSKQSLSDLVFDKQVRIIQEDMDRYGRVVGRVYVNGLDVTAEQVKRGMAWVYKQYARDRSLYRLEEEARAARRGLWSDPKPGASVGIQAREKGAEKLSERRG